MLYSAASSPDDCVSLIKTMLTMTAVCMIVSLALSSAMHSGIPVSIACMAASRSIRDWVTVSIQIMLFAKETCPSPWPLSTCTGSESMKGRHRMSMISSLFIVFVNRSKQVILDQGTIQLSRSSSWEQIKE